ncbi:PRC-barrel domain-containing protein [Rubrobacter xylanophilus]|uniref:PRC-barrel domain-containing protein n=1 Tax=Rubrobacter xylanophilus TaxID=49319 RepID=UPI001C63F6F2|nr:PRC-barrel domain-containing protein [Rubrobacter xylanophilus]
MEEANHRADNPYTEWEGYEVVDASGEPVGRVERAVYDAPSGLLKYLSVDGRTVPAENLNAEPDRRRIRLPHPAERVRSAPPLEDPPTGGFDAEVRRHYGLN